MTEDQKLIAELDRQMEFAVDTSVPFIEAIMDVRNRLASLEREGWKMVPVEPTEEMLNAAIDTDSFKLGDISPLGFRCSPQMMFERCYAAMLSAAPKPEVK